MELKAIQFIDYMLKRENVQSKLVVKSNGLIFSADFLLYESDKRKILIDNYSREYNYSPLWIGYASDNSFNKLEMSFGEKYMDSFTNKFPNWDNRLFLEKLISFTTENLNRINCINSAPKNIELISPQTSLEVLLLEPDQEFTIIGLK